MLALICTLDVNQIWLYSNKLESESDPSLDKLESESDFKDFD